MCSPTASWRWSMGTNRWTAHQVTAAPWPPPRAPCPIAGGATPGRPHRPGASSMRQVSGWRGRPGTRSRAGIGRAWSQADWSVASTTTVPPGRTIRTDCVEQCDLPGQVQPVDASEQDDSGEAVGRNRHRWGRTSANTMAGPARRRVGADAIDRHADAPRGSTPTTCRPARSRQSTSAPSPDSPTRTTSPEPRDPSHPSTASNHSPGSGGSKDQSAVSSPSGSVPTSSSSTRAARYRNASQTARLTSEAAARRRPGRRRPGCRPGRRRHRPRTVDRSGPSGRGPTGRREDRCQGAVPAAGRSRVVRSDAWHRRSPSAGRPGDSAGRRRREAPARRRPPPSSPPPPGCRCLVVPTAWSSLRPQHHPSRTYSGPLPWQDQPAGADGGPVTPGHDSFEKPGVAVDDRRPLVVPGRVALPGLTQCRSQRPIADQSLHGHLERSVRVEPEAPARPPAVLHGGVARRR